MSRDIFGNHHRAMLASGTAESDGQITLAFVDVMREEIDQQVGYAMNEFRRLRKRTNVFCDLGVASGEWPELGDEVRVGQKTNVEHQVSVIGHAVLESEAHERD